MNINKVLIVLIKFSSQSFLIYSIVDFSIYRKEEAITMAGNTRPTSGTKIDGR